MPSFAVLFCALPVIIWYSGSLQNRSSFQVALQAEAVHGKF